MIDEFNQFVSDLVYYYLQSCKDMTVDKLSESIGVSSSFMHKCLSSTATGKHFNLRHVYLIANTLNIPVSNLIPSRKNYQILYNKELSQEEWNAIFETHRNKGGHIRE